MNETATDTKPRGIRNNNPGNVDYDEPAASRDPWEGLDNPPSDGRFCRFTEAKWGLRVIVKLMLAYQRYDNCGTIRQIINRWAPATENDTSSYVGAVSAECGTSPNDYFNVRDPNDMLPLVRAIVREECGENAGVPWFDDVTIKEAMRLADPIFASVT